MSSTRRAALCAMFALLAGAPSALAQASAASGTVQAGATINHDTVTVGDVVILTVRVRAPQGATINFPAAVDSLSPVQSIEPPVVRNGSDSASAADRIATYRLAAWDIGSQPIKLEDVLVQSDEGDRRIALPLPTLFVRSVLPADTTLRIPKPARPLIAARPPIPWWWWLAGALAAIAIGIGAWWLWRRRATAVTRTGDPYADAMAAFARIEQLGLLGAGEVGRHAALMTDVTRRYLAERFPEASLANTSRELLVALRYHPTVPFERLRRLLADVDPVKFAAARLDSARAHDLGSEARAVVSEEHAAEQARLAAARAPESGSARVAA